MRTLKKIGKILLVILILFAIGIGIFIYTLKPDYSGKHELVHLQNEVGVYYDNYGIPHIYGQNDL